jgi:hypothetical protein
MNAIPSIQINGSKTKFREVSPARKLRSVPGFHHISLREMSHARPALLTVFSTLNWNTNNVMRLLVSQFWKCFYDDVMIQVSTKNFEKGETAVFV